VTADARYILWVNGQFVGRGPARGVPWAQPFDEIDLAPFLAPGHELDRWRRSISSAESTKGNGVYAGTGRTGSPIEGELISPDGKANPIRTDATWQARRADWSRQNAVPYLDGAFAYQECVDGRREPADWRFRKRVMAGNSPQSSPLPVRLPGRVLNRAGSSRCAKS